ncbi:MAG TPA: 4Fe-4S dicluster domain-containing protein [Nitrospinota bacterium]|jgi:MauM/NapG family ferredoxin protein|nr:4Fe-4S dicluster domain-containing protein [Nitrospinota bacterium]|tara:strand:- start:42321 stop:42893 length:573 start_codon:yes stop_codon:yes gene_type:complete
MKNSEANMDRKTFLKESFQSIIGAVAGTIEGVSEEFRGREHIRPPGAVTESDFRTKCTLCNECIEACPYNAIQKLMEKGPAQGTPVIIPEDVPCYLCDPPVCSQACPDGALLSVKTKDIRIGVAVINKSTCFAHQGVDKNCDYCYDRCPLHDKAIFFSKGPSVVEGYCVGCGICAYFCVSNPKSIKVFPD